MTKNLWIELTGGAKDGPGLIDRHDPYLNLWANLQDSWGFDQLILTRYYEQRETEVPFTGFDVFSYIQVHPQVRALHGGLQSADLVRRERDGPLPPDQRRQLNLLPWI